YCVACRDPLFVSFFCQCSRAHRHLHSFPTRRSSDLSPISKFKYSFMLLFFIAQLITVVLYMGNHYEYLLLLALPASIILSRFLRFTKREWQKELGLWIIIGCVIAFKIAGY